MSPTQGLCFVLFVVALVGSTVAEILLLGDTRCGLWVLVGRLVVLCGMVRGRVVWCGMVLCGVVGCGMVGCGMIWCGMVLAWNGFGVG